ncbi:MAG: conjugal transfer protein TraW [Rickettsiaceae bacterium]|nr:conjugal transfer protein TraW [Rickettsiaceae bacterium]
MLINLLFINIVNAKDFGKRQTSFPIAEEGFTLMIKRKLQNLDLAREKEKMLQKMNARIARPRIIKQIPIATRSRQYYYDPTYILTKDISLPDGKLLYKKGTKINPLDHIEFKRRLFFIDGDNKEQITWLKSELIRSKRNIENRIILVIGNPIQLNKELTKEGLADKVYFDQNNELVDKFMIQAVPARLEQDGNKLKIEEIKLEQKKTL